MRIDSRHRPWLNATLIMLGTLTATYVFYRTTSLSGRRGGSIPGITYGVAGYGLMVFAALLGVRKKVPVWRVGAAQTWMRGHLWLGFLTLPLILFHCAFRWTGTLAGVLMTLLFVSVGSGILGATLQHFLPRLMTRAVPLETIYEEIPHVRSHLCSEADNLAASISAAEATDETLQLEIDPADRARFGEIYAHTIRPRLAAGTTRQNRPSAAVVASAFDSLRRMLPVSVHPILIDLENICEEERQLQRQRRIYLLLHGWLLVHVPVSVALLVLGAIHAVIALRY